MLIFLGGCQVMEKEEAGGEMLEYSIVDEKKVPAEMTERIAGMEETPFQIMCKETGCMSDRGMGDRKWRDMRSGLMAVRKKKM